MGLADLPTLAEVNAVRRAVPKYQMAGRTAEKAVKATDDTKAERACLKAVWTRDKGRCRVCGVKVLKSLERTAKRGETHHLAGRADQAVRFDPRNRILLCAIDHERIELHKLFILARATQMFQVGQTSYINGAKKLTFREAK